MASSAGHVQPYQEVVAGTVGGALGVIVGHPFDTVKIRVQSAVAREGVGVWRCFCNTLRSEGLRGFYRGVSPPLATDAIINAVVFSAYGVSLQLLVNGRTAAGADASDVERHANLLQIYAAGASVSLPAALLMSPVEMIKARLQVQTNSTHAYRGVVHCLSHTLKHYGIRGLYTGLASTYIRDIPSFGVYFLVYHLLTRHPPSVAVSERSAAVSERSAAMPPGALVGAVSAAPQAIAPWWTAVAGGLTGVVAWAASYPADVIKTRIQTQMVQELHAQSTGAESTAAPRYSGFLDCVRKSYRAEGIGVFFRGLSATMIRAFPVNAALFLGYEVTMKLIT